jgi:hypothetical protein
VTRFLLAVCVVIGGASVLLAQAHPCDTLPAGPWIVKSARQPVIGWCQAGEYEGFQVSVDGALTDIGKPAPAVEGEGVHGVYYVWTWPTGVAKNSTHTFGIRSYLAGGGTMSAQAVLRFRR